MINGLRDGTHIHKDNSPKKYVAANSYLLHGWWNSSWFSLSFRNAPKKSNPRQATRKCNTNEYYFLLQLLCARSMLINLKNVCEFLTTHKFEVFIWILSYFIYWTVWLKVNAWFFFSWYHFFVIQVERTVNLKKCENLRCKVKFNPKLCLSAFCNTSRVFFPLTFYLLSAFRRKSAIS